MATVTDRPAGLVESTSPSSRGGVLASVGALGAAILASLCCIGPILVLTLGVGAGLASTFEPLRPWFTGLTAIFLAVGFYTVYGRKPAVQGGCDCCATDTACAVPRSRTRDKVILWTATVVAVTLWTFPYWSTLLI